MNTKRICGALKEAFQLHRQRPNDLIEIFRKRRGDRFYMPWAIVGSKGVLLVDTFKDAPAQITADDFALTTKFRVHI